MCVYMPVYIFVYVCIHDGVYIYVCNHVHIYINKYYVFNVMYVSM